MCAQACFLSKIKTIYFALEIEKAAEYGFKDLHACKLNADDENKMKIRTLQVIDRERPFELWKLRS
jgi:tRNA(Arg) A34 adenosine deaminase TadA